MTIGLFVTVATLALVVSVFALALCRVAAESNENEEG